MALKIVSFSKDKKRVQVCITGKPGRKAETKHLRHIGGVIYADKHDIPYLVDR